MRPATTRPDSYASTTAWTRSRTSSFVSTRATCVLTVAWLTTSSSAISAFERPRAISLRTSSSRGGQLLELRRRSRRRVPRQPDELLDHPACDRRCEQRLAARNGPDSGHELLGRNVLEQKPARPGAKSLVQVLVHVEGREHDDLRLGALVAEQQAGRLDSVHGRHPHVHQDDVRAKPERLVTASSPFDASPTTSRFSCASRIMRKPARTSAWSSTISTRTLPSSSSAAVAECSARRSAAGRREPAARSPSDCCSPRSTSRKVDSSSSSSSRSADVACETRISPPLHGPADARGAVDRDPVVLALRDRPFARVDPDPDAKSHAVRPFVRGERALRGERGQHRVLRPAEGDEETVALRADALAARRLERAAQQPVVVRQHVPPPIPDAARELRRPLDIAEEKREGAARRRRHRSDEDLHARRLRGGSGHRKRGVEPEAALGPRPRIELSAVYGDPLTHADEAVPALDAFAVAGPSSLTVSSTRPSP